MHAEQTANSYPKLVDAATASEILGVSKRHVYNMAKRGEIKAVRFGRSVRINLASVLEDAGLSADNAGNAR